MQNPNFKETNKILIEDYEEVADILVYKLKNISNAFYLACLIRTKNIQILKYSYETKSFKNIGKINVIISYYSQSMKYIYNPLDKKEYFFITNNNDEIEIYLIKKENTFKYIRKLKYINNEDIKIINNNNNNNNNKNKIKNIDSIDDIVFNDSFEGNGGAMFTSFNSLDVIYNESEKNIYVIIIYFLMQNAGAMSSLDYYKSKSINIFKFKDGKLNLIKTFKFDADFNMMNLIYINNKCDKKYLIDAYQRNDLSLIELKLNYNNYKVENFFNEDNNNKNKFSDFIREGKFYGSCIVYGKNNFDFLYILEENKLMIINFTNKNIDKIVDFDKTHFSSVHNWNNNYIILLKLGEIYIYDIINNKIISKYKKEGCQYFQSHFFPGNDKGLAIFKYYDKIECYFV